MSSGKPQNPPAVPITRLETQEIDELAQYIKDADIELIQISRAQSPSSLTQVIFDNVNLQIGSYGSASMSNASSDSERFGLLYRIDKENPVICNSHDMDRKTFMFYGNNAEHSARTNGPCRWSYMSIKPSYLEEFILDPLQIKLDIRRGITTSLYCQDPRPIDIFCNTVNEIAKLTEKDPISLRDPNIRNGIECSLLDTQVAILSHSFDILNNNKGRSKKSREHIIKLSIDFLKANSYKPVHVPELCSALNIRMRMLFYAFQEFYGISPMRYLKLLRFGKARRDLLNADPKRTTVSDVAAKWHFWHFGRFSVEYRELYGESPSDTLNQGMGI